MSFPELGVSLAYLCELADSPALSRALAVNAAAGRLGGLGARAQLRAMAPDALRRLARRLRACAGGDARKEFAEYADLRVGAERWIDVLCAPPRTTAQVAAAVLAPQIVDPAKSFLEDRLQGRGQVGMCTDFVSHSWRADFKGMVEALQFEAAERDRRRATRNLPPIASTRYYWIDIFVEPGLEDLCQPTMRTRRSQAYVGGAFRRGIEEISRTIHILNLGIDGVDSDADADATACFTTFPTLRRAWCLHELLCTVDADGAELAIAASRTDRTRIANVLLRRGGTDGALAIHNFLRFTNRIDFDNSDAFVKAEAIMIRALVIGRERRASDLIRRRLALAFSLFACSILSLSYSFSSPKASSKASAPSKEQDNKEEHRTPSTTLNELAFILLENGRYGEAEVFFRQSLSAWRVGRKRAQIAPLSPAILRGIGGLASALRAQGRLGEAKTLMNRLLRENEAQLGKSHPSTLSAVGDFARILMEVQELDQAETWLRGALDTVAGARVPAAVSCGFLEKMGSLQALRGDLRAAATHFQNALDMQMGALGASHDQTLETHAKLATVLEKLADTAADRATAQRQWLARAESCRRHILHRIEGKFGTLHLHTGSAAHNLGKTILLQLKAEAAAAAGGENIRGDACAAERFVEAEKLLQRALGVRERHFGDTHATVLDTCHELARLHQAAASCSDVIVSNSSDHHVKLAEALFRRSLYGRETELPPGHTALLISLNDLALFLQEHGNSGNHLKEAICLLESAVERATATTRKRKDQDSLIYMFNLADALVEAGRLEEAETMSQRAWQMIEDGDKEVFFENAPPEWRHRIQRRCHEQLCSILRALGKHDEAAELEEESA
jgi:tetratricopeptide (TPR) repeat protein